MKCQSRSGRGLFLVLAAVFAVLVCLAGTSEALKLEIQASPGSRAKLSERCIRNRAHGGQLVVVTATISGERGDGQTLDIHIKDTYGNDYGRPRDVVGENRYAFTAIREADFDVCFINTQSSKSSAGMYRQIELDIDIGADAKDWAAIQADKKLKPVEADLRRAEELLAEVVKEMDYLRAREQRLRNTNESTNERVGLFGYIMLITMTVLFVGQAYYLQAFLKSKHLI